MARSICSGAMLMVTLSLQAATAPSDLVIITRTSFGAPRSAVMTDVFYAKGERRRHETTSVVPGVTAAQASAIALEQCDVHQQVLLFPEYRTFTMDPIVSAPVPPPALHAANPPPSSGPVVTITIDTIDTGERRQVGSLVARHMRTTRTTTPSRGASTPARVETTDGWYVDVDRSCQPLDGGAVGLVLGVQDPGRPVDRIRLIQRGPVERGVPIELTRRDSSMPHVVETMTLVDLREAPLDSHLFEIPTDYRAAVPLPFGGFDPSRPDSVIARVQVCAEWLASLVTGAVSTLARAVGGR